MQPNDGYKPVKMQSSVNDCLIKNNMVMKATDYEKQANEYTEILLLIKKRYDNGKDNFLCNCYMEYVNNYISLECMFDNELSHFVVTAIEHDRMLGDFKELMCAINILCKMANNKSYFDVTELILKIVR